MLVSTFLWWHWSRNEVWQLNHIHGWNETKNARLKHFTLSLEPWRTCPRICSLWKLKIGSNNSKWAVNYIPTVFVFRSTTLLIRYFETKYKSSMVSFLMKWKVVHHGPWLCRINVITASYILLMQHQPGKIMHIQVHQFGEEIVQYYTSTDFETKSWGLNISTRASSSANQHKFTVNYLP